MVLDPGDYTQADGPPPPPPPGLQGGVCKAPRAGGRRGTWPKVLGTRQRHSSAEGTESPEDGPFGVIFCAFQADDPGCSETPPFPNFGNGKHHMEAIFLRWWMLCFVQIVMVTG